MQKKTPDLIAEVKEQASHVIEEIKNKDAELNKSVDLMRRIEKLDLTLTPTLYLERGNVYLGQGNTEKALDNYNESIKLDPDNYESYYKKGATYQTREMYREAIPDYQRAVELNPKYSYAYAGLGVCYRKLDDHEKSLQSLNKAIALNANSEYNLLQRSMTYRELKKFDLAIVDCESAAKISPKSPSPLEGLGLLYAGKNNHTKAIEYYLKALEIIKHQSVMLNLSESYICIKDYTNAEKYANEAYLSSTNTRSKILSKYLLVIALILNNKDYKGELTLIINLMRETVDFKLDDWTFDEVEFFLEDKSLQKEKTVIVRKLISLLKQEIKPEDFNID